LPVQLNWYEANYACKLKGMELVSIETKEENDYIYNQISKHFDQSAVTKYNINFQIQIPTQIIFGHQEMTYIKKASFTGTQQAMLLAHT
jgi:hypothetical protein